MFDQYPWLILDQALLNPWLTLNQHFSSQFVKSQLTLDWCLWLSWHSAHFQPTVDQASTEYQLGLLIKSQSKLRLSVNYRSIKHIDRHSPTVAFSKHDPYFCLFTLLIVSEESQKPIWIVKQCIQCILFSLLLDIQKKDWRLLLKRSGQVVL